MTTSNLRTLVDGIGLGESPRWHDGRLWFCDWVAGEIVVLDADGRREVVARMPTFPISIDWLPDGRMLIVNGRTLFRRERDGTLAKHADLAGISDRPWNEIVVDGRGNAYVNGIGFDMMAGEDAAPGVIALVTADGTARRVADDVAFPNGMAVTADNSTLIVAESYARRLTAFSIAADGTLSERRVWAELGDGVPDGICIDAEGGVWYADVPNRCCVRVREGAEVLDRVDADRGCFACMLGGAGRRTLFVVAAEWGGPASIGGGERTGRVVSVRVRTPGVGWP